MPPTARLALPVPLEADTPDVPRDIGALADRLDLIAAFDLQGLAAARPAAGVRGRYYWATDTEVLSRDTGAAWKVISAAAASADFLDAPGRPFQEGIASSAPNAPDGLVTFVDGSHVNIAAGSAWIDGDGVAGVGSGRYRVSWAAVANLVIPAAVASRLDQIIVRLSGVWGAVPTVELLQGGDVAGVTLDNRTGAAALPAGCLRLADLNPATGLANQAAIRDRRPWARGARVRIVRNANAAAGNDYSTSSGSYSSVDATNLSPRLECSGTLLRARLSAIPFAGGASGHAIAPKMDGAVNADQASQNLYPNQIVSATQGGFGGGRQIFEWEWSAPTPGSHVIALAFASDAINNPFTLAARAQGTGCALIFTVEEELRPSNTNN